jgi:hypothetical protein
MDSVESGWVEFIYYLLFSVCDGFGGKFRQLLFFAKQTNGWEYGGLRHNTNDSPLNSDSFPFIQSKRHEVLLSIGLNEDDAKTFIEKVPPKYIQNWIQTWKLVILDMPFPPFLL